MASRHDRQPGTLQRLLGPVAKQVDAGPQRELVLVLDGAGWHSGLRITLPAHLHLVSLPPYSPELQPAERLWTYSNTPLVNAHFADLDALEDAQLARCAALQTEPPLIAALQPPPIITGGLLTILQQHKLIWFLPKLRKIVSMS